ncbi:molybdopterin-dependent oxidoreductase [Parendozoicomonas haliclonae]|uniref:Assimilatory nitrate reductase catalytic subunit n=1 Tax=Parendozoicomonas haliclonae TaxID=1960125 RepID=A0A1X7AIZ0_9GAMM|nr:molybdopterin-dependent oxidoreductase [Parendozoicomonas haliclonae]SMA45267.1 Assimilatory nitrate reductase catalytic subunit [Parendozoicomonas haliclonae]
MPHLTPHLYSQSKSAQNKEQAHFRACNLCEAMCGIKITHNGSQILSIKGDAEDPFSRGHICPKAVALQDIHEDPDRIRQPLLKTEDGWKEIGWEEALDRAAEGIRRTQKAHGKDAVATYLGNPNVHNTGNLLMGRHFFNAVRTRNRFSATSVDQLPHHIVAWKLFGHQLKIPVPDIDHTTHMVIIGGNPLASNGSIMTVPDVRNRLKDIQKRGGQFIVIDPRRTETAELADEHHFIKPGTDAFLLMAILNTLFEKHLIDTGRLTAFLDDFDSIKDYVSGWTPERAAAVTGISAQTIHQLAVDFGKADRPVMYGRMGVSVQVFGLLCQFLIMLINIATGRLDEPGGLMFTRPAADILKQTGRGHFGKGLSRVRKLPEFNGEFPVAAMAEEMLVEGDGQVRGLVTVAGNPVLSTPNGTQLEKGLEGLDFMVSIDFYLNETTRHADLILPPVSPLERDHYDIIFHLLAVRNTTRFAGPLFPPPAGAMEDWQIFKALEDRLRPVKGLTEKLARKFSTPRRLLDILLRSGPHGWFRNPLKGLSLKRLARHPHGIDLGELKPSLPKALYTKDKRIHLQPEFFFNDLKRLERFESQLKESDTLLLFGRRHVRSNNSWLHNSHRLIKSKSRCTVMMHPTDAKQRGISEVGQVSVSSRVGNITLPVEITDAVMSGTISIPHGWGHNREGVRLQTAASVAGQSINDLTDDQDIDLLSGNAVLNGIAVRAVAVESQDEAAQEQPSAQALS